jgi:hypothetical protein
MKTTQKPIILVFALIVATSGNRIAIPHYLRGLVNAETVATLEAIQPPTIFHFENCKNYNVIKMEQSPFFVQIYYNKNRTFN